MPVLLYCEICEIFLISLIRNTSARLQDQLLAVFLCCLCAHLILSKVSFGPCQTFTMEPFYKLFHHRHFPGFLTGLECILLTLFGLGVKNSPPWKGGQRSPPLPLLVFITLIFMCFYYDPETSPDFQYLSVWCFRINLEVIASSRPRLYAQIQDKLMKNYI